jgi:hypothetical protein
MNRHISLLIQSLCLISIMLLGVGCAGVSQAPAAGQEQVQQQETVVAEAQAKREQTMKQYKEMTVPQLAEQLVADSDRGLEPFNSMAFTEMVGRGEEAAPELAPQLKHADHSSLLGLLALRKMSPKIYRSLDANFRVLVLVETLKTTKYFNTFGLPSVAWEDAAKAIIEEGEAATGELIPLLKDERPAPTWGSEDYMEYQTYQYRVKDYAWALLLAIRDKPVQIPVDPAERDRLIKELQRQLG